MRLVRQEHSEGCGVAALAMLLDVDYPAALEYFVDRHASLDSQGLGSTEVLRVLAETGHWWREWRPGAEPPNPEWLTFGIALVMQPTSASGGHYIAFRDGKCFDPGLNSIEAPDRYETWFTVWQVRQ